MSFGKKLRDFFGDRQAAAIKRVRTKVHARCEWDDVKDDIFPAKGTGAPMSAVIDIIIEAKHWKLLTPIAREAGGWIGVIDLVYRKGEYGPVPASREHELEDIYKALAKTPVYGKGLADAFVNTVSTWSCQRGYEPGYDWAAKKPEFNEVSPLGLAALCEHKIDGNPLAMKILSSDTAIKRAKEAVEWIDSGNAHDRDDALQNLDDWIKQREKNAKKPAPPKPPRP